MSEQCICVNQFGDRCINDGLEVGDDLAPPDSLIGFCSLCSSGCCEEDKNAHPSLRIVLFQVNRIGRYLDLIDSVIRPLTYLSKSRRPHAKIDASFRDKRAEIVSRNEPKSLIDKTSN